MNSPADLFAKPDGIYLLSHSVGLPLRDARYGVTDYFDTWERNPVNAWPQWLRDLKGFRSALAALLGGNPESLCPQANVSGGLAKILGSLLRTNRNPTILLSEDAFPSVGYVCEHAGYNVRYIDRAADPLDPATWASHFDDVHMALITHVHSNTGEVSPVAEIVEAARKKYVVTIVDVAQSAGVIPIDVEAWRADFLVGSCVKWLCGGPGAGWLWANPKIIERCQPIDVGWFSHEEPFEFDIHNFRYAPDALRFWGGTPSVLPAIVARRSIEAITNIGITEIRRHNLALTDQLIEALGPLVVSPHDPAQRGGTVIVDAGANNEATLALLAAANIAADHRATGIRISPHIYNSPDDIAAAIGAIKLQ